MDKNVWIMGLTRLIYSFLNLGASVLIWRLGTAAEAIKVNSVLGSLGPFVFILVSGLGMAGLSRTLPPYKMFFIVLGIVLIMVGVKK